MKKMTQFLGSIGALTLMSATFVSSASANEVLNLITSEAGMHRISYAELKQQGADLSGVRHRRLGLSVNGQAVAVRTAGQSDGNGRFFGPGGFIEFYAGGSDSLYTDSQAFTLSLLSSSDARTQRINFKRVRTSFNATAAAMQVYQHTQLVEENRFYDTLAPSDTDPWHYGQTLSLFGTPTYSFSLENVAGGSADADIKVEMYGLLDFAIDGNDHHFDAIVNGVNIGDQQFDGNTQTVLEATGVKVNDGANSFKYNYLPIAGVPFDRITLNRLLVSYPRSTQASNGYLQGYFDAPQSTVSGLGDEKANVYRKYSDGRIEIIIGARVVDTGAGRSTGFAIGGVAAEYIVVADSGFKKPSVAIIADEENIKQGDAEYLVIAHPSLMNQALDELVQIRQADYSVKVVDVQDIYAQFGNHLPSADAIQRYIKYAADNLSTRLVVLIGNDSSDYKNYQSSALSLIPTRYVTTPAGIVNVTQAPSDAVYGDINNDRVPDLAVGRIPARTEAELANVVEKIRDYRARSGYVARVLVASDKDDVGAGIRFSDDAEELIAAMPSDWGSSVRSDFKAYPDIDGAQGAKDKLIRVINAGVSAVSYIGHSSQQRWSFTRPTLLRADEIAGLSNIDKPTVVTQWGCWTTYFVDPNGNNMADQFLLAGRGGAVASLGASTLTSSSEELALGIELNKRLFEEGVTIGEAMIAAKQALAQKLDAPAMQLGYQIIGDPATVINIK